MKVGWVLPHFSYGKQTFFPLAFLLAKRLMKKGIETVLIAPKAFNEPIYETIDGIEIFRSNDLSLQLKLFKYPLPINLFRKIIQVVEEKDIDVLNWHGYHYLQAIHLPLVKRKLKIPTVLTVISFPGVCWHYPLKSIDYISQIYAYSLGKFILNSADTVVIDFPHNAVGAKKLSLPEHKLEHIPWGVDTKVFMPMKKSRQRVRSLFGFKEDDFVIGYCGRLVPVKGIDVLIAAVSKLLKENEKVHLLVIGGGDEGTGGKNNKYEDIAHSLLKSNVLITGWVEMEKVPLYWQAADVAVLPSFSESGGGGAMEPSACGIPVIASRTGGLQDTVVDQHTGFLVTPGKCEELYGNIKILMENPDLAKKMGENGRNYMKNRYNWNDIAEKYIDLYSKLIDSMKK